MARKYLKASEGIVNGFDYTELVDESEIAFDAVAGHGHNGVNGKLVAGKSAYASKTANYTVAEGDKLIGVDTNGGAVTITLASSECDSGRIILIKDEGGVAATNNITVDTEGAETIDGAATDTINTNYGARGYYSDGTNWFKV